MLSRRRFLDMVSNSIENDSRAVGVAYDTAERFSDLAEVRRLLAQKNQGRTGVVARATNRLRDFVSERRGQFSHHAQAGHVSEILLQLAQPLMLLLRAYGCCHIGAGAAIATEFSVAVKHRLSAGLHIHWRAVAAHREIYEVAEWFA
jgi:hypothetical protein